MIKNASFIPDESKLCINFSSGDMFDRIINLKITCYNESDSKREVFVIRSDYEMIYPDISMPIDGSMNPALSGKTVVIRRCSQKPSIKVQCKMVSTNTGISVDIFVSNFFLLSQDGKHLMSFNNSEYRMETVEVCMGYWGQFKTKPANPEEFFDIKAEHGADKLTLVSPIVVTTEKLPPDSVLRIKGYVASIFDSPVDICKIDKPDMALQKPIAVSGDSLKQIMYKGITQRYLNLHYFTDGEGKDLPLSVKEVSVSDIKNYPVSIVYDEDTALMIPTDADRYGVRVYLTERVEALKIPKIIDEKGNEVDKKIYFENGWTIGNTIARLSSFFQSNLSYTFNRKGDILVYTTEEVNDPESLYSAFVGQGVYRDNVLSNKGLYDNKLPAVYNINIDAVATITCPFFTFIEPFQYLEFASRYALTSVVSYFASYSASVYKFYAINALISFATVEDINEVQITAVSARNA